MNIYETDPLLSEYLLFHYGKEQDMLPWPHGPREALHFPVRCVTELLPLSGRADFDSALDIGCAVGRSSFELARFCKRVTGIDYSARFVEAAAHMQREGSIAFDCTEEGKRMRQVEGILASDIDRSRARFEQGDAQHLPENLNGSDLVLAANLVCRLREPAKFLERLPALLRKEGILLLCTPCTWLETFTPVQNWPGSRTADDRPAFEGIREMLSPHFDLLGERDLPFLIREHARKYQWSVSHGSVWRRQ